LKNRKLKLFLPIFDWLPSYGGKEFRGDIAAGLTIGGMLIPQGMAYAKLAGMPPIHGLYAALLPAFIYAIFGTSRQLSVGPVAIASLLVAAGVGQLATEGTQAFVQLAFVLALMVGVMKLVFGFFKLGFLVNFLSNPVIAGFTSAACLIIVSGQIRPLFGLDFPRQSGFLATMEAVIENISDFHLLTFAIGAGGIALIFLSKKINKLLPAQLFAVIFGIAAVYFFNWDEKGVKIVGDIPEGLPFFVLPDLDFSTLKTLFPTALTITLVGFVQAVAIAKVIQEEHKTYRIKPNQELAALGLANLFGSFFQSFPVTGGFARTAANDSAGAKTPMAGVISSLLVGLTLLYLTSLFYYLPSTILASIIIAAVLKLFNWRAAVTLWQTDKRDLIMMLVTFLATLFIGIEEGILTGIALSLAMMIFYSTRPHIAELGRIPGTNHFRNVRRFKEVELRNDVLILRFDAQLYFANAEYFREQIEDYRRRKGNNLRLIILNSYGISNIDSTAFATLFDIKDELAARNVELYFIGVIGPVRDLFKSSKVVEKFGENHFFVSIQDALAYYEYQADAEYRDYALQSDV
jgi:SulP family sulfate permease